MTHRRAGWSLWFVLVVLLLGVVGVEPASAQQTPPPDTIRACYVPATGTIYRIGAPGLPSSCLSQAHVAFAWSRVSSAGVVAHSELQGLDADDHPRYLLLGGVRNSNSGFAVAGTFGSADALPASGAGTRLLWYPAKAAFRVGRVTGSEWDLASLGESSVAMGVNTLASGQNSVAFGENTSASGPGAAAFGLSTSASGSRSVAFGLGTTASGLASTAFGTGATASGLFSIAAGIETEARAVASLVIGRFNAIGGDPSDWIPTDPLFVAGNGTSDAARSNALTLYKNGDLTIAGTLTQSSDARLKEEIEPLEGVLDRVLRLQPVTYRFREDVNRSREKQIGLLAQEVAEEFPELVKAEADGYLSLSYTQLAAVLVQALREQEAWHQAELAAQAERMAALQSRLAELERLLAEQQVGAAAETSALVRHVAGPEAR